MYLIERLDCVSTIELWDGTPFPEHKFQRSHHGYAQTVEEAEELVAACTEESCGEKYDGPQFPTGWTGSGTSNAYPAFRMKKIVSTNEKDPFSYHLP